MMNLAEAVDRGGFAIIPDVVSESDVDALLLALERADQAASARRRGSVYAVRNLLHVVPEVRALAGSPAIRALVERVLGPSAFPVRGILFDKNPDANWKVAWHQDLSIAVQGQRKVDGFGPWSEKAGVTHVQPPATVLERMITVRLHLDDCTADNGPVRVIPGSHSQGRLGSDDIQNWRDTTPEVVCLAFRGSALLMRPLLLHASSPAQRPAHRRVIHIEYASEDLPDELEWYDRAAAP